MEDMLSRSDVKTLARLQQKKFRLAEQKILVEGPRLIIEALRSDWTVEKLVYTGDFRNRPLADDLLDIARSKNIRAFEVSRAEFKKLSDTVHPQGVLAVVQIKRWPFTPIELLDQTARNLFVAIERLQDPGNLGTIIRCAEWLGANAVVVGPECVEWGNPKALRASMGAVFYIPVFEIEDFYEFLAEAKRRGAVFYAADQQGDFPYSTLRYAPKKVLLLGEEARGLSEDSLKYADYKIAIPKRGKMESLNVSIAAAILMAEMVR